MPPLLPRVDGTTAVKTPLSSSRSLQSDQSADQPQQAAVPIPRLQLSPSMHSNLETRNAVAELQVRVGMGAAASLTWKPAE